ncbi:lipid-A-disaccharide synthase N-terminal domain-containing protein [Ancylobacter sp. 6x-1]|uniref:Lipid-A-disaccharide synthase N-terminal domain-containing protein n=1 Tax=Ancylobacter crimeensis TaxID=2579147 RepID=A0ABT0D9Y0_9HYPH|nr:lipid-A-disaccharide synthase N-terminal domain-containing protein [Ancylobacter crimeensis]MCK0196607.1 lipid-A-disaccharide synthase N-terminal domain-containing protein [Ancylobacter crimeensis]
MTLPFSQSQATLWLIVGFVGQGLFTMRFVLQWLASERARRSVVPVAFWTFSLAGGATLLAYAVYRGDPVFIVGQACGLLIYLRNVYFIWREKAGLPVDAGAAALPESPEGAS